MEALGEADGALRENEAVIVVAGQLILIDYSHFCLSNLLILRS